MKDVWCVYRAAAHISSDINGKKASRAAQSWHDGKYFNKSKLYYMRFSVCVIFILSCCASFSLFYPSAPHKQRHSTESSQRRQSCLLCCLWATMDMMKRKKNFFHIFILSLNECVSTNFITFSSIFPILSDEMTFKVAHHDTRSSLCVSLACNSYPSHWKRNRRH